MEKKDKIIIASLIIVVLVLIAAIVLVISGALSAREGAVPNGMQKYNFDSAFTMNVPEGTVFKKSTDSNGTYGQMKSYRANDRFLVGYIDSPMITPDFVKEFVKFTNKTGNATIDVEGNMYVLSDIKSSDVLDGEEGFSNGIILNSHNKLVVLGSDDEALIKQMAESIDFLEGDS